MKTSDQTDNYLRQLAMIPDILRRQTCEQMAACDPLPDVYVMTDAVAATIPVVNAEGPTSPGEATVSGLAFGGIPLETYPSRGEAELRAAELWALGKRVMVITL